jgi:hypothetical protein
MGLSLGYWFRWFLKNSLRLRETSDKGTETKDKERPGKTRQDKTRQDERGNKMLKHNVEYPTVDKGFFASLKTTDGGQKVLEFDLLDGTFILSKGELFDAYSLLYSEEFYDFCTAINKREDACVRMHESAKALHDGDTSDGTIMDLQNASVNFGRWDKAVTLQREKFIKVTSWCTWVDTCRLYEATTGIPREYLG